MKNPFIKVLATVLTVVIFLSCMVFSTSAADTAVLKGEYVTEGENVTLTINLTQNPGINTLVFKLGYNTEALTLLSYTNGTVFDAANNGSMFDLNTSKLPLVCYFDENGIANITATGTVLVVNFAVADTSKDYGFTLEVDNDNTFACSSDKIAPVDVVFSEVSIGEAPSFIRGDVNKDGKVNAIDASTMAQYLVGSIAFDSTQLAAGDLNGDGKVNATDANLIGLILVGQYE